MGDEKCKVIGSVIHPCDRLLLALFNDDFKITTGNAGNDILHISSEDYIGSGIIANFCPFCGSSLVTWRDNSIYPEYER